MHQSVLVRRGSICTLLLAGSLSLSSCGTTNQPQGGQLQNSPATASLESQGVSASGIVSGQIYNVINGCAGSALTVSGASPYDGAQIVNGNISGIGSTNQRWKFESTDSGYYKLIAQNSNKVLEVSAGGTANGSKIQQWNYDYDNRMHQQWKPMDVGDGFVSLAPRHAPDSRLDAAYTATPDGSNVHLWGANTLCMQKWRIESTAPIQYSGKLVITDTTPATRTVGNVRYFSGNWQDNTPRGAAVEVRTQLPIVIEKCNIKSAGYGINIITGGADVTVKDCRAAGINPNQVGNYVDYFIISIDIKNLIVENNYFEGMGGILVNGNGPTGGGTIKIRYNEAKNINGRFSNGNNGWLTSTGVDGDPNNRNFYPLQFAQFTKVINPASAEIAWNKVTNLPNESRVEDNINIGTSRGSSGNPILIHHNLIQGAYAYPPNIRFSGGGILIGDGCETSRPNEYIEASDNTVIETTNYGMAIANGRNMKLSNNTILGLGKILNSDGTIKTILDQVTSDAGIYMRNYCNQQVEYPVGMNPKQYQYITGSEHDRATVLATNNKVGWGTASTGNTNGRWDVHEGEIRYATNGPVYSAGIASGTTVSTNIGGDIPQAIQSWQASVTSNNIVIGPR